MATRKTTPAVRSASKTAVKSAPVKRKVIAQPKPVAKPASKPASKAASKAEPSPAIKASLAEAIKVKHKLVRDSFTIPKSEYLVLDELKQRATRLTRPTKKGELIRAGIAALNMMSDTAFLAALGAVPSLKTGRPKKVKVPEVKATRKKG